MAQAMKFDTIDTAVDWVKSHREEIVDGAIIVIVGVNNANSRRSQ
jgi:hypothetical protein